MCRHVSVCVRQALVKDSQPCGPRFLSSDRNVFLYNRLPGHDHLDLPPPHTNSVQQGGDRGLNSSPEAPHGLRRHIRVGLYVAIEGLTILMWKGRLTHAGLLRNCYCVTWLQLFTILMLCHVRGRALGFPDYWVHSLFQKRHVISDTFLEFCLCMPSHVFRKIMTTKRIDIGSVFTQIFYVQINCIYWVNGMPCKLPL